MRLCASFCILVRIFRWYLQCNRFEQTSMRLSTTFLFLTFWFRTFAQTASDKCELNQRLNSTLKAHIDVISETEYTRLRSIYFKSEKIEQHKLNSDSLEKALVKMYPATFSLKNSCYTFKSFNGQEIKVCKFQGANMKEYSTYEFVGTNCNLILINTGQYESWGNLYVNPNTGEAFSTMGEPIYLNCDYLYSHSSYYGEEEISIVNLNDKRNMVLIYDGWSTVESFAFQRTLFLS